MTHRLYLYRHAKSDWSDPARPDRERPLNERGQRDARRMARALADRLAAVEAVACSPSLRTRLTLEALAQHLPPRPVLYAEALYEASPDALDAWLRNAAPPASQLLIVGHEYGLSQWARRLCPTFTAAKIPTAGCLALGFECASWAEVRVGKLSWFMVPKALADETE